MIACPKCGGDTQVVETRTNGRERNRVRRRRMCASVSCATRVTTIEMPIAVADAGERLPMAARPIVVSQHEADVLAAVAARCGVAGRREDAESGEEQVS